MPSATGVRLTLKFNFAQQIRFAGWSESYDLSFTDLPTAIAAKAAISAFIVDRCYCLGGGPILVEAVLGAYVQPLTPGSPPLRRATISFPVPLAPLPGNAYNDAFNAGEGSPADFASTVYYISLQTNLSSSPVYHRNCWIAGLPDISDESRSARILEANTQKAINIFVSDLNNTNTTLGGRCGVSIRSVDRSGANPIKNCTAWNQGPNTYTVPAHGFAVNQPILAEGMRAIDNGRCPRGRYLVAQVVDANTISLQGALPPADPDKLGGFRAAVVTFNQVQVAQPQGFTKRDKGRPSGLSVGRRVRSKTVRA